MKSFRWCLMLLASAMTMLSGCATITMGSSQTVVLTTEPVGAACTFNRDGAVVGVINPTPGSLNVSKSHSTIDVSCVKDGFLDAKGVVGKHFQPMTFGNILFGGIIGIVVDAASGATAEYEPTVSIRLIPSTFANIEARDNFFDQERESFIAQAKLVRERITKLCEGGECDVFAKSGLDPRPQVRKMCNTNDCDRQLRLADEEQKLGLERIEVQRNTSTIKAP